MATVHFVPERLPSEESRREKLGRALMSFTPPPGVVVRGWDCYRGGRMPTGKPVWHGITINFRGEAGGRRFQTTVELDEEYVDDAFGPELACRLSAMLTGGIAALTGTV